MKSLLLLFLAVLVLLVTASWGFFAHRTINRLAVYTLPKGMSRFYKANIDFITEHAVDADKRRYTDTAEAPRHFLDADHYGKSPFDSIPQKWADAEKLYTRRFLTAYGTVPWQIQKTCFSLVKAFSERDSLRILRLSADLGHYVGDAHVPLHTTENYNGQLTGQTGIHAFWESRLPELFAARYDFFVGKPQYIPNSLKEAWKVLRHTFSLKDSVLLIEAALSRSFPVDKKFTFELVNGKPVRQYAEEYALAYHQALHGMVEEQMRRSVRTIASLWYSAWLDAGQPNLNAPWKKPGTPDAADPKTGTSPIGREL